VIALLIIAAVVLLAATAYTIYRRQHAPTDYPAQLEFKHARPRSLFDDKGAHDDGQRLLSETTGKEADARRAALHKRAGEGDLAALAEAHRAKDAALYRSVLARLVEWAAESESNLHSLASFIANDAELRGSRELADAYTKLWQQNPDRTHTAQLLHLTALSDEAETFERAVAATVDGWRAGRLAEIKPEELSALVESEYWVLSSEARRTGAGFVLKQKLAHLRDELLANQATETTNVES
jgi:hypothetical protein